MKTKIQFVLLAFVALTISVSAFAQNKKKYSIYLEMNKNGKEVVVDTSFATREELEAFMKSNGYEMPAVPPPPAVPRTPASPGVPPVPPAPPVPPVPPLPDDSDMKQIIIEIDDSNLSFEDSELIEEEMKKAHKEMRKARTEMKHSQKDMEQLKEELKNLEIEIERSGESGKQIIIREHDGELSVVDGQRKMMVFNFEDDGSEKGPVRIIRLHCDSLENGEQEFVFVRKMKAAGAVEATEVTEQIALTTVPSVTDEVEQAEAKISPATDSPDYQLKVSDFKLYPNPTAGKVNVSFKSETPGKIQIRLLDGSGKVVVEDEAEVQNGYFNQEYNIEGKSRGTYLLQIKQGDKWRHEKVVLK